MRISRMMIVGAAAVATLGIAASPAMAQPASDTDVTFEVEAGTLDITAPAAADLGLGQSDSTLAGPLGVVTVVDSRGLIDASWAATVTSTAFQTGTGTPGETIDAAEVEYWSGPVITSLGDGEPDPGQTTAAEEAALDTVTPLPAFAHDGGTGGNTESWNPNLTVNIPLEAVAGDYTGTVTHSVA